MAERRRGNAATARAWRRDSVRPRPPPVARAARPDV